MLRGLVTVVAGILCGIVGTFAHRMGASANIPYGLVLAFLILGISAWCARSRLDVVGLALHLMFLPARWFAITPKTDGKTDDKNSQQPSQLSVSRQTPDTLAESR